MSHEIYNNSMAYVGDKPWHNLGHQLTGKESIDECLVIAGMDHKIQRRLVRMRINPNSTEDMVIPGYMAITRDSDNHVFQVASDRYVPMQYQEMVSLFRDFIEAGDMRMGTLGLLKDGAIAWAMAEIGESFTLVGGDKITGNLVIATSHDGSLMTEAKLCETRIVCWNTLMSALVEKGNSVRIKHSKKDKKGAIAQAKVTLGLAKDRFHRFEDWARVLSTTPVKDTQEVYQYLIRLTGSQLLETAIDATPVNGADLLESVISQDISSIKTRKILSDENLTRAGRAILDEILDSPGANLESAKGTWWGVLNGVTHYFDHNSPTRVAGDDNRSDNIARADNRLTSAWYGVNANTKEKALDLAYQYATRKVN